MTKSSFYGDTPNYATTFPTQNDTSAKPVTGNTQAPSSFYQNGTSYTALALTSPANALYLGSFTADPTLNLIGGALVAGNLYYNTTSGTLKSYNGSAWASLGGSSGVSSAFGRTGAVVATANDYSFAQLSATPTTVAGYGITDAAPLASPAFTGTPSAPTATLGTNTTQLATTAFVLANAGTGGASPATVAPLMDATAAVGTSLLYARQDHVHPTDTSIATGLALKAPLASPSFTGTPTTAATPAALDNSLKLATTAYADGAVSTLSGTVTTALGLKAPLASPALTGVPVAPTAAALNNSTQLATTAYADAAVSTLSGTTTTALALKAPLASPTLTGVPAAPTAAVSTNTTQLATTAFVLGQLATVAPLIDGTAAVGTSLLTARQDHVHPTDTTRAPLASPAFTGTPTVPTATALTNSTTAASTAYADAAVSTLSGTTTTALALKAPLAAPTFTGVPAAPTAAANTNTTQLATTAFVVGQAATVAPVIDGTATVGTSLLYARQDHVHPTDTTRAALASPTFTGVPAAPTATVGTNTTQLATTAFVLANAASAGVSSLDGATGAQKRLILPQGRLSLLTLTPVTSTAQNAKTTLYYTPYQGNEVPIYDGTNMLPTTFTEISVLTTDTTKNPAAIGVSKVNDWFVWSDAGTLRLSHGPDWTSDTARSAGTALVMVGGILLNSVAITNGPAASRGTYVGTTRSNATSSLDLSFGGQAAGGTAALVNVWNCYNRVNVACNVSDATGTWSYSSATTRATNASNNNRISFVSGLAEDGVYANYQSRFDVAATSGNGFSGIGLDTITTLQYAGFMLAAAAGSQGMINASAGIAPQLGAHFIQALENSDGTNANIWVGGIAMNLIATLRA